MLAYIFDLDGTLFDIEHRLHFIVPPKLGPGFEADQPLPDEQIEGPVVFQPDWPAFYRACVDDLPIKPICEIVKALAAVRGGAKILFLTGRSDEVREQTASQIVLHLGVRSDPKRLYMRKVGDHRSDEIVKSELLDEAMANGFEPIMIFEDRARVVKMWRARGIFCAQVADGEF